MKYKVKISDLTSIKSKEEIYLENCYLGISINNPFFLSNHLELLIEWVAKRFGHAKIIIGDHLHRINAYILYGIQGQDAINDGLQRGKVISERFENILQKYPKDMFHLEFWEKYYNDTECQKEKAYLYQLLDKNEPFKQSIIDSATDFIERQISRGCHIKMDTNTAINNSVEYLLEEMAVFSVLIGRGYKVQVYPGTQLNILKELALGKFPEIKTNLSQGIYIDLTVKKIK